MKFAFFILYLIQLLPFAAIHKLADFIGTLAYYAVAPRRRVGEVNLRLCYPEWNEAERKKVLKRHFQHMAKLLCEYGLYWYADAARLKKLVRYQDKHYLDEALAVGEKVILLYPHFTAFEMAVYTLNQDVPLVSMYSHQKNKAMDEQILKGRHRYNNVFLIGRTEGLRAIIKHLRKSDAPFLYLPDQDFGRADSIFVDFFGIPTATIAGLSRVAAMTGAAQHKTVDVDLRAIGGSALTDDIDVPEAGGPGIPVTYVPALNTIMLSVALGWAEVLGASDIFCGVNAVDYSGYPDCRPEFIEAFEKLANLATKAGVEGAGLRIHAPLLRLSKADIVREGMRLGVDFSQTVSCYQADAEGRACGHCDACRLRAAGFEAAGVADPTRYLG